MPETPETALSPSDLARLFHETYERLAPEHGYETRKASAVPWEDVPAANKSLMTAVAGEVLLAVRAKVAEEIEPILKDIRKAARTHHYKLACEGTDAALGRLRAVLARGDQP